MAQQYSRRLYRSSGERMLGGICGGLAEYFDADPVLMRLIFVAGTLLSGGIGVLLYVVLWIVVPKQGAEQTRRSVVWRENADEMVSEARRLGSDIRGTVEPKPTTESAPAETPAAAAQDVDESGFSTRAPHVSSDAYTAEPAVEPHRRQTWAGLVMVVLGLWLLANNLNLLWWVRGDLLLPLAMLGVGGWLLVRRGRDRSG